MTRRLTLSQSIYHDLCVSACRSVGIHSEHDILEWVSQRTAANNYSVRIKPLDQLSGWSIDDVSGDLRHHSGKFFQVEGLSVEVKSDVSRSWLQPIINQPEVGILGFICQELDGVLHFLVQAKMEPGNINVTQISPTVQATRSNYTQVHGGRRPAFVEFFIDDMPGRHIVLDQLQSEQGTRYLKKRNRNIIVVVESGVSIELTDDYRWVTLGQLQNLMRFPDLVHLDCRSIIGSISFRGFSGDESDFDYSGSIGEFQSKLRGSIESKFGRRSSSVVPIHSWITGLKCKTEISVLRVPLRDVSSWSYDCGEIKHISGAFFSIIGVEVTASNREVPGWSQPLIRATEGGILGLLCQVRDGVLKFLVQALVEPGLIDILELAPTVQCTPANYLTGIRSELPYLADFMMTADSSRIRFDSILSDEGGRFFHTRQRHLVVELSEGDQIAVPENYRWMTLGQIQHMASFSNSVNIELRSILSCLSVAKSDIW
ncbi:NDP-hexose 2,3-dehydratase family protein [Piscinibacter sakaiensis]|uniref:NDP-hexose 2,3-dehydratase family protein n=1 Tax=Piscinibacter sakaiensis TaxID=1547922 RepID=UPI003AABA3E4